MAPLEDSVVARLASARGQEEAFLARHHVAAAEQLERLIRRALLTPRLTMSYDPAFAGGHSKNSSNNVAELGDTTAEARLKLNGLAVKLGSDCWNVAFDVCGIGKGLQAIEAERSWPRRSAKLVLRVALELLACEFGLTPHSAGHHGANTRGWLEERLPLIDRHHQSRVEPN
jgi:hypothetical protein